MTTINDGIFRVELNGETIELKATLGAIRSLSNIYGGLAPVRQGIAAENLSVLVAVIRYGAGMNDVDAKNLDNRIFRNGMTGDLLVTLMRFVGALANGGKPVEEDPELAHAAPAVEGNE